MHERKAMFLGSVKSDISETKCIAPLLRLVELRLVSKIWSADWKKKNNNNKTKSRVFVHA